MQVQYTGPNVIHLMHEGKVWEVHPGDVMELPGVPKLPHFNGVPAQDDGKPKRKE